MLCPYIMMVQSACFVNSQFDDFLGTRCEADLSKHNTVSTTKDIVNPAPHLVQFYAEVAQYFSSDPFTLAYQAQQKVFCADVIMLETLRLFLSKAQDLPGPHCELIKSISVAHVFIAPLLDRWVSTITKYTR